MTCSVPRYHRPHEPYVSPKKYCDLYPDPDTTNTSIRLPPHKMPPVGMPDVAWSISGFVKGHPDVVEAYNITYHNATLNKACHDSNPETANVTLQLSEQCLVPEWKTARMRQAYWGAISYVDAMVGRLLNGLDSLQLTDSTIVVFWGVRCSNGLRLGPHCSVVLLCMHFSLQDHGYQVRDCFWGAKFVPHYSILTPRTLLHICTSAWRLWVLGKMYVGVCHGAMTRAFVVR